MTKFQFANTIILFLISSMFFSCKINHSDIKAEKFSWYYKTRKIHRVLIDTRPVDVYEKGHIPEAVNIPISEIEFKKKLKSKLPKNATDVWIIFVYAQDESSTRKVKKQLTKIYKRHFPFKGPTALFYIEGGYQKWLEVEK